MAARRLLLLVEGTADERLFKYVLVRELAANYSGVEVVTYRTWPASKVCSLIDIYANDGDAHLLSHDRDSHRFASVQECVDHCTSTYASLDPKCLRVQVECIESWYLAVAGETLRAQRGWTHVTTDGLSKSDFRSLLEPGESDWELKQAILADSDLQKGLTRNTSLGELFTDLP